METTETTPPETTDPPAETPPADPPTDRPPENVAAEEKRKRTKAERENRELRERLEALESKDQSELERERKAREKAEQERTEFASRVESLEKGGWVRDAALQAKFIDPSDAVAHLNLSEIEDEADAKRAVKALASSKKHLVQSDDDTPPRIGQVLKDGKTTDDPAAPGNGINLDEEAQMVAGQLKKFLDSRKATS